MKTAFALLIGVVFATNAAAVVVTNGSLTHAGTDPFLNSSNKVVPNGWTATPWPQTTGLSSPNVFHDETDYIEFSWDQSLDGGTFVHALAFGKAGTNDAQEGITQSITGLTPGQKYAVGFEQSISYSNLSTVGSTGIWEVYFDGTLLTSSPMTTPLTSTPFGWQTQTLEFIATAAVMDLSFVAASLDLNSKVELGIDGISVTAVPVPAAVWLFGSGMLGLLAVARRRRQ